MLTMTNPRKAGWGRKLKALRDRLKFATIEEAAAALGVSKATWSRWETGQRTPSRAHQYMLDRLEKGTL